MARRDRTRQLIELGGLVAKAGLIDQTQDDRPLLMGAFLSLADAIASPEGRDLVEIWRRRGLRALTAPARTEGAEP